MDNFRVNKTVLRAGLNTVSTLKAIYVVASDIE